MEQILQKSCHSESYSSCFTVAKPKRMYIKIMWGSIKEPRLMKYSVAVISRFVF